MSNDKAIALVQSWLDDKSGYDRRVWPQLARPIERNRLSNRRRLERARRMKH